MNIKRYLSDNNEKIIVKNVKSNGGVNMNTNVKRYCTVAESLEQSLKEMQLIRQGKLPKKTWREYRMEKAKQREKENRSLS